MCLIITAFVSELLNDDQYSTHGYPFWWWVIYGPLWMHSVRVRCKSCSAHKRGTKWNEKKIESNNSQFKVTLAQDNDN
jgi:hypothetical protein